MDGTLRAQWEELDAELGRLRKERLTDPRLNSPIQSMAKAVVDLQEAMRAETVTFTIQGMPRSDWENLLTAHPAREDNPGDKSYGFNPTAVTEAAIAQSIVKVEQGGKPVKFDPAKEWDALADDMTNAQYEDFFIAILKTNRGRQDIPFSVNASTEMRPSEQS